MVAASLAAGLNGWLAWSGLAQPRRVEGDALRTLVEDLRTDPRGDLNAVVIVREGRLVAEGYFNGEDEHTLHDIRSAAKSITSTLVGIAIDRGLIGSVDDPIGMYLPGVGGDQRRIRVRDLLTMRSGLAADDRDRASPGNENRLDESRNWLTFALALPMPDRPGAVYHYASVNAFLAGAVVEKVSGLPLDRFAERYLFSPLGIRTFVWRRGPQDRVAGQGNLRITARDAARIGELFLDRGEHHGRRIVSAGWIQRSLSAQVSISSVDPYADAYGFMWYTKSEIVDGRPTTVHFASGNGGNKIYIVPASRLVIAITSSAYDTDYGQKRSHAILRRVLATT
jgi:CubicO group peptidase (beta-lactamase class C family)